jgi:hypothetical protein
MPPAGPHTRVGACRRPAIGQHVTSERRGGMRRAPGEARAGGRRNRRAGGGDEPGRECRRGRTGPRWRPYHGVEPASVPEGGIPSCQLAAAIAAVAAIAAFAMWAAPASAGVDRKAPSKPANLRLTAKTTTTISIAWDAASNGQLGQAQLRDAPLAGPARAGAAPDADELHLDGARPSVQYYLWVVAIDAAGNKSFSDQLIVETPRDTIAPTAPTNLRVDSVTASQVALSWDPATDEPAVAPTPFSPPPGRSRSGRQGPRGR